MGSHLSKTDTTTAERGCHMGVGFNKALNPRCGSVAFGMIDGTPVLMQKAFGAGRKVNGMNSTRKGYRKEKNDDGAHLFYGIIILNDWYADWQTAFTI